MDTMTNKIYLSKEQLFVQRKVLGHSLDSRSLEISVRIKSSHTHAIQQGSHIRLPEIWVVQATWYLKL